MPSEKIGRENEPISGLKDLPRPQKNAVIFLSILAILIVIFWIWQVRAHINQPFSYPVNTATTTDINVVLQNRDTDVDGLSDYDEIYIHKTSPYLEDSDSDGLPDRQEINQGTDPNCPTGKNCNAAETVPSSSATSAGEQGAIQPGIEIPSDLSATDADEALLQKVLAGQADAATLRALYLSKGVSKEELDKISDADLMKSYQETLQNQSED